MSDTIRVAQIMGKWYNYGVENLVLGCYLNTDRSKIQYDFIIDSDSGNIPYKKIEDLGGRVIIVPPYQNPVRYHKALRRIFRKNQYRIVHSHIGTMNIFPLLAAKEEGIPIRISHVHNTAGKGEFKKNTIKYILRLFSKMNATHYGASSIYGGKWLFGKNCFKKYDFVYLPVARELSEFIYNEKVRQEVRQELKVEDNYVVGHLGRFVPQKNHSFLMDVFYEVKKLRPDAVLLLAGDGVLEDEVRNKVHRLSLDDSVIFLGQRKDAARLYQAMDVFVLPSLYEGVPGVGIESQAAGLPFIYSDAVTDEAGILPSACRMPFSIGPQKWAEKIVSYDRFERTNTIMNMEEAGYSIEKAAKKLQNKYIELSRKEYSYEIKNQHAIQGKGNW